MSERVPATAPHVIATSVAGAYDQWAPQYDNDVNATRDLDALVIRRAPLRVVGRVD